MGFLSNRSFSLIYPAAFTVLIAAWHPLWAQTAVAPVLTGVVTDTAGVPISAVHIRLVEGRREEQTGPDGSFRIVGLAAGTYTLIARRIGFQQATRLVRVDSAGALPLHIQMRAAAVQLAAMVVTGTISERSASEVISPTTVVDAAQLARKLSSSIAATLQREPGVSVAGMGPATARPVVRGLGGDRVVILEDGARPGDLSSTSPDHAVAVDPLTVSRFEVVRGPMSLLYGSSALGGVVNVIRDEIPTSLGDHVHGAFSSELASVNRSLSAGAVVNGALGNVALRAEGSARRTSDLRTPVGTLDNTELQNYSVAFGSSLVSTAGHVGASYRYYHNEYGIPGGFVGGHVNGVDITMRRHTVKAEVERRPQAGPFAALSGSGAFTDYYHAELQPDGDIATSFEQQYGSLDLVARHSGVAFITQGAFGLRGQYRNITTAGALNTPSTRDFSVAGFAVEEWESGVLHLQAGLRYDWARFEPLEEASVGVGGEEIPALPRNFGSVSGSLGALLHASEAVQFGASLSRAYRTPDFNELYSDGPHLAAYSYDVGNPRIGQETGLGIDVFARMSREGLRAEAAWFRNRMSGFVFPVNTGTLGASGGRPKFQYIGKDAVLTGAEGVVEWSVIPRIVVEGNLSYVRGALAEMPDSIPAIGEEPARAGARYLPLMPPLNGNAGVRYETELFFAGVDSRFAAQQDRLGDFESITPGYAVLNASAGVRLLSGERLHSITLRFDNITNREYRDHLSRVKDIMPQAGRNVSLLYRVTF